MLDFDAMVVLHSMEFSFQFLVFDRFCTNFQGVSSWIAGYNKKCRSISLLGRQIRSITL